MDLDTALSGRIHSTALAVGSALLLISCGVERPNAAPSEQAEAEPATFSAGIRGVYEGEISGDGVLRFLPEPVLRIRVITSWRMDREYAHTA